MKATSALDELVEEADVLTFHTPLYKEGRYKTLHLADEALIRRLKPGSVLINACRGPVVDNGALLACLQSGQALSVVLDVWEPEPDLNLALLDRVDIGTAHIAGYTLEGKARGTTQVLKPTAPLSAIRNRWRWTRCCQPRSLAALPCTARSISQR
jgi:erythronate-4-phosphate dehydrogenase